MKINSLRNSINNIRYKYILLRKDYRRLDQAIEKEEDESIKYHLMFEKSIALQKYESCFEILKQADSRNVLFEKDIELYVKGILAKYEKGKEYKKVIELAIDILNWKGVDKKRIKSMVYHLLGNSYYFTEREKELVDLVEFLKTDKDFRNHPLVRWASTPVKEMKK